MARLDLLPLEGPPGPASALRYDRPLARRRRLRVPRRDPLTSPRRSWRAIRSSGLVGGRYRRLRSCWVRVTMSSRPPGTGRAIPPVSLGIVRARRDLLHLIDKALPVVVADLPACQGDHPVVDEEVEGRGSPGVEPFAHGG